MKRRIVVALVLLLAAGVAGALYVARHSGDGTTAAKIATGLKTAASATPAQAQQTTAAFAPGRPLGVLQAVGATLEGHHAAGDCSAAAHTLGSADPPTTLREAAALLEDPVAADLTADLVTAEGQVLASCTLQVSAVDAAELQNVDTALTSRLAADSER